jgi:hypothetical protein
VCCIIDATLGTGVGRIDVASPWKGGARNWVGRRVVASTRKGGANERVCIASLMQH